MHGEGRVKNYVCKLFDNNKQCLDYTNNRIQFEIYDFLLCKQNNRTILKPDYKLYKKLWG